MEVVQGKSTNKKIIIAQEIAFAKVLAGNNKTLRDQALKKLKKWLTIRGNGKWAFTEDEFLRIWTGLFYCMWMSDKFLIQEELAENISQLIHCFKKNSEGALLFIKCFNKRLLMEYEGLDQYRVDKFNMLIRRVLRQSFEFCRRLNWDDSVLKSLVNIFNNVVFDKNNPLGFVLHFINIYPEELAKVSKGKLENKKVLLLIEPFVILLAKSIDDRLRVAATEFFYYLIRQTDIGIEFEEKFKTWKQLGFPGRSVNSITRKSLKDEDCELNSDDDSEAEEDEDLEKPLDPRAGSLHVDLPQISFDVESVINLLKKYERGKNTVVKGRRRIRNLIQKFSSLKKGRFPSKGKKHPIIDQNPKKSKQTHKNALNLLKFTSELDKKPIKSGEFEKLSNELNEDKEFNQNFNSDDSMEDSWDEESSKSKDGNFSDDVEESENKFDGEENEENHLINNYSDENDDEKKTEGNMINGFNNVESKYQKLKSKSSIIEKVSNNNKNINASKKKRKKKNRKKQNKSEEIFAENDLKLQKNKEKFNANNEINDGEKKAKFLSPSKTNANNELLPKSERQFEIPEEEKSKVSPVKKVKNIKSVKGKKNDLQEESLPLEENSTKFSTPTRKNGLKRKVLGNWQVQELDESNAEYHRLKPQKIIKLEVKINDSPASEEKQKLEVEENNLENSKSISKEKEILTPVNTFLERAKAKAFKNKKEKKLKILKNPFSTETGSPNLSGLRRISFALDKNMAQENEEYLEEVRNSPQVPFDRSKKPIQSALKSGLSPSPINPFYRFKKIKF